MIGWWVDLQLEGMSSWNDDDDDDDDDDGHRHLS
jgi:hypothetical protein